METNVDNSCTPIDTSHTPIGSVSHPKIAGVALDSKGWWEVQLFYYVLFGGFLLVSGGSADVVDVV